MFAPSHYIPVVKWKRGEQTAIAELSSTVKSRLTPLIELIRIPQDLETGEQTKTLEEHVSSSVDQLVKVWGTEDLFYLDCGELAEDFTTTGELGPKYIFDVCDKKDLKFIPTIPLDVVNPEFEATLDHINRGLCIRLTPDDFERPNLEADLQELLKKSRLSYENIDLNIDIGTIEGQRTSVVRYMVQYFLEAIPNITKWRTLILTASAFPYTMGIIPSNGVDKASRIEWLVWKSLYENRAQLVRLPNFGDYGIQHPAGIEDFDPRYMTPAATIRYTLQDDWIFVKGESMKKHGGKQFSALASKLVNERDYYGSIHCRGCEQIFQCHQKIKSAGRLEDWRRIGTNHHLTVVTEQLAELAFD